MIFEHVIAKVQTSSIPRGIRALGEPLPNWGILAVFKCIGLTKSFEVYRAWRVRNKDIIPSSGIAAATCRNNMPCSD